MGIDHRGTQVNEHCHEYETAELDYCKTTHPFSKLLKLISVVHLSPRHVRFGEAFEFHSRFCFWRTTNQFGLYPESVWHECGLVEG